MEENLKRLLLIDLCARLPYGVKIQRYGDGLDDSAPFVLRYNNTELKPIIELGWKPYLRPMSSMTKEELKTFYKIEDMEHPVIWNIPQPNWHFSVDGIDWLLSKQFDYRGLIEKGIALEAPKDMYKIIDK